jgi:hypothetical protein
MNMLVFLLFNLIIWKLNEQVHVRKLLQVNGWLIVRLIFNLTQYLLYLFAFPYNFITNACSKLICGDGVAALSYIFKLCI